MNMQWISRHDLVQERTATQWEQGLMLGNGKIGGMVWGGGKKQPLIISVDQAEVWELRAYQPPEDKSWTDYKKYLEQGRGNEVKGFQREFGKPFTTRIPVGRVELFAQGEILEHTSRLSLYNARVEGCIKTAEEEIPYAVWTSATRELLVVEHKQGLLNPKWKFICRHGDYTLEDSTQATAYARYKDHSMHMSDFVARWNYPPFDEHVEQGMTIYSQDIPESGGFAVVSRQLEDHCLIAVHWSEAGAAAAVQMGIETVKQGEKTGLAALRAEHEAWWNAYYEASAISIPDTRLEGYYYMQMYTLACSTRPGGVHMTLCGPWTDDNNIMPICGNDYHWNLEQEMQLWSVYAGNRIPFGDPMLDMIENNMDTLKEACRFHFKTEGAFVAHSTDSKLRPTYMNVDNYELNGMPWVCLHYWKRYLYTMDKDFLRNRAYPVMKLSLAPLLTELTMGEDGKLHMPWTSSPEYHGEDETRRWLLIQNPDWGIRFGPDATIDLSLTKNLLKMLCDASEILECDEDLRAQWKQIYDQITPYPRDEFGGLAVRADVDLKTTHRHMSHLFPIYPIGEMTMKSHGRLIERCLDVIGMNGRGEWVGWTFPWISLIYTRAGRAAAARNLLMDYVDRYVSETGIHYQGPQGGCDVSLYQKADGLFGITIEAQLGVPEAIHEMLMRTEDGVLRIFKDAPPAWANCGFETLRTEGAFLVDAKRNDYETQYVRIYAEKGGKLTIDTDFGDGELHGAMQTEDGHYVVDLKAGETALIYRGDEKQTVFAPEAGNPYEDHFWGVKKIRRF